jgi:CRP/FNR family transcriptional regulator, cyclic AMP receptor protein
MSIVLTERSSPITLPQRPLPPWPTGPAHPELRIEENASIQAGTWFAELSEPLRHAILGRARVRQIAAGTRLAQRGDPGTCWVGVARGAVRLGTALSDGRNFTLDFVGPSQWFGDIALIDDRPLDLDVTAHAPTTLLTVSKLDLHRLIENFDELRDALLQLNCQRLRHMFRRFEELHTLPLAQRLARQVQRLARQFGRPSAQGVCIELGVSQGDLAAMVGGSRQRVNRAWRQMHHLGIVQLGQSRLLVLDQARLGAVADGRLALPGKADAAD